MSCPVGWEGAISPSFEFPERRHGIRRGGWRCFPPIVPPHTHSGYRIFEFRIRMGLAGLLETQLPPA